MVAQDQMKCVSDVYNSGYLKGADIPKGGMDCVIDVVEIASFKNDRGAEKPKPVVFMVGEDRALVCNVTNAKMIAAIVGSEKFADWSGAKIRLVKEHVPFGADVIMGIRVNEPTPDATPLSAG